MHNKETTPLPYNIDIDSHEFTLVTEDVIKYTLILQHIGNKFNISTEIEESISKLILTVKPKNNKYVNLVFNHKVNHLHGTLFTMKIYKHYIKLGYKTKALYYASIKFHGLVQYKRNVLEFSYMCMARRDAHMWVLHKLNNIDIDVLHNRIDVSVDYTSIDYSSIDIITNKGIYREWDSVEIRELSRYSRKRQIVDEGHVVDSVSNTTQMVLNIYDKGKKGGYEYSIIRVEYKLYNKAMHKVLMEKRVGMDVLTGLIEKNRVLVIGDRDRVMSEYMRRIGINSKKSGKYRKKYLPELLAKYSLDVPIGRVCNAVLSVLVNIDIGDD